MPERYVKGQPVILRRKRTFLGIVVHVDVLPVGRPGPHRYRYHVQPARLVDGKPRVIEAALGVPAHSRSAAASLRPFRHRQPLEARVNTRIWHVWMNARNAPHERFGATRITVVAEDDVDAYNEARQEIEARDFEAGFPISAEPLKVGTP